MTREDINDIINAICSNDEDYEKPCISPKYLRQELEQLALDQRQWNQEPATKNDSGVDCISRAEAIKCLECDFDITGKENMKTVVNYINSAHDKIMNLPRVKQDPRWIPVSERLPEESGEYFVTVIDEDVETYKHTGIAWYAHPKDYSIEEGDWRELMFNEKVIAWMLLPTIYGEVEE